MSYYFAAVISIAFILTALVAGNNLSAAVGTLVGSRTLSRFGGSLLGAIGFSAGLLVQGGRLHSTASSLLPSSHEIITLALLVALFIFILANLLRVPLSLIMALVGTSIGLSLRFGTHLDSGLVVLIALTWILAPVLSIILSYLLNRWMTRWKPPDVWSFARNLKILLLFISFFTAFTLGANTIGFISQVARINGVSTLLLVVAIFIGSFFLSGGIIRRVGSEMYMMRYTNAFVSLAVSSILVEGATFLGIPLSNTQTLTSSVFGSGLSYRDKAMNLRPFFLTVATWIASPVLGILFGYLI
ncbi:inorganic phosphate transporter family protein [Thermoplasmatales archaeon AK]|nr:inorganic phosphate transporter family protein [Thermoplasmatales archaeon AK]